jgi:predicted glycoside hydrolase/deacetylase ChbG (UPF0249 family)
MRRRPVSGHLGYGSNAKLLIVHADDLGLARSVNAAFSRGLSGGFISSGSAMVPCPWFSEIVDLAKKFPNADIGLHLTLTSHPVSPGLKPVAPPSDVPSLVDSRGYLWKEWGGNITIHFGEVEIELRAQIEKAFSDGLLPTHLDSHLYLLQIGGKALFDIYVKLAREYRLPMLIPRQWFNKYPYLEAPLRNIDLIIDSLISITPRIQSEDWLNFYTSALGRLQPGITEVIIHPGIDDDELRSVFGARLRWGAAWRQRDFECVATADFAAAIARHGIQLTTWRELTARLRLA